MSTRAGEFFCQACGRHTSHAGRLREQPGIQITAPKYCRKPALAVVSGWRTLLDDAAVGGSKQTVLCSDVQKEVFSEYKEGDMEALNGTAQREARNPQELGMRKAKQREDTRRAARLIYYFGFQHFSSAGQSMDTINHTPVSPTKSSDKMNGNRTNGADQQDAKVEAMQNGKVIQDVTHAKGEWGLRYKRD
ncbi:hypothetical protein QFC21_001463 [Naganishia friedmannii]|uniref:Uncharacterized protein n=1 Tax=Naganishia friedmannii TaxID=89922 RepID=A0ACC2W4I9_9TREE|nr:hypothetical protein QFC21_001463 [Naganishia friedmannii]